MIIVSRCEKKQGMEYHSPPKGPRKDVVKKLDMQQHTTATHNLESKKEAPSAGFRVLKHDIY